MGNDFSAKGAPVSVAPDTTILQKIRMLLGHYDLRVFLTDTAYVDIGRGSFDAVKFIGYTIPDFSGCIGVVGQFCNFARTCELFGGGEHRNDMPVNVIFTPVPAFAVMADRYNIDSLRPAPQIPFMIGNGVVISGGAKVLPGAEIGDGALVATGGVVAGKIAPFSISGGVPAKHIKYRLDETARQAIEQVRWWDFDIVYMGNNLAQLQEVAVDTNVQHVYKKEAPRFVLKVNRPTEQNIEVQILGFIENEELRPLSSASPNVLHYVKQLAGDGPYHWVPDIWNL